MQSPPRRSRLFRPTPQRPRMRRRTDPSLIRVRTPQRQHRGRRLSNLSRGSKHHPRARSPDSHPRSRASTGLDALLLERHCGIFQRPPRSRAHPPPRGVPSRLLLAVPRLHAREFFLKRSVLLRLHLLQSSPRRRRCRVGRARPRARTAYRTIDGDVRVSAPRAHGSHRREQFRANRRRRRRRRTRRTRTPARRREGRRGRRGRRRRHRRYRRGIARDGVHLFIGARAEIRTRTSRGGGRQLGKLGGVVSRSIALGGVDGPRGRHIGLASRGRQGQGRRDRRPHRVVSPRAVRLEATRQSVPRAVSYTHLTLPTICSV